MSADRRFSHTGGSSRPSVEDEKAQSGSERVTDIKDPPQSISKYQQAGFQQLEKKLAQPDRYHRSSSPPREPRSMRERDDRSVTPPPPRSPSPSYLALAHQAPQTLTDPLISRKLLILDLNGTLLYRSAHTSRSKYDRPRDSFGRLQPRLRPVHPRPYMPAFRSYLFASETKTWLDVMIWSSAQPHSVSDMVDKCFANKKRELLAVWARDTLGLSEDHYHRKVQTVKDLATPWSTLPSLAHPESDSEALSRESTPPGLPFSTKSPNIHSALTTLLLDDSPLKAQLQPFNHVCIPEYDTKTRQHDLARLEEEREEEAARLELEKAEQANAPVDVAVDTETSLDSARKRKRKAKKERRKLDRAIAAGTDSDALVGAPSTSTSADYDETLLAVIGVLDEIKGQQNVAAWIRAGGLWGPDGNPTDHGSAAVTFEDDANLLEAASSPPSSQIFERESSRRAQSQESEESDLSADQGERAVDSNGRHTDKKLRRHSPATIERMGEANHTMAGNDSVSAVDAESVDAHGGVDSSAAAVEPQTAAPVPAMWFEHFPTVRYWIARGRRTLRRLGIPVEHGIEG